MLLLPGGFVRIKANFSSSSALITHLLRSGTGSSVDVAAVPVVASDGPEDDDAPSLDLDKVHSLGTAARVVEFFRQAGREWVLVLQGRFRVAVSSVSLGREGLYTAEVRQLDYLEDEARLSKPASGQSRNISGGGSSSQEAKELKQAVLSGVRAMFSAAQAPRAKEVGDRTMQLLKVISSI